MAQKAWQEYLTKEQYDKLGPDGRMLADYWTQFLPKMCKQMHAAGTLVPTLQQNAEALEDYHVELLQSGLREYEALEFIKEQVYSLPMEE